METLVLSVDVLLKYKMTPNQFFLGYLISQKKSDLLIDYVTTVNPFWVTDLEFLTGNGFVVDLNQDPEDFSLRDAHITEKFSEVLEQVGKAQVQMRIEEQAPIKKEKFMSRIEALEKFNLFWSAYPKKRGVTKAPLKVKKQFCEGLYVKYLQQGILHEDIMRGLEKEKQINYLHGHFQYMQSTETWLRGKGWEPHLEEDSKTHDKSKGLYGGTVE